MEELRLFEVYFVRIRPGVRPETGVVTLSAPDEDYLFSSIEKRWPEMRVTDFFEVPDPRLSEEYLAG